MKKKMLTLVILFVVLVTTACGSMEYTAIGTTENTLEQTKDTKENEALQKNGDMEAIKKSVLLIMNAQKSTDEMEVSVQRDELSQSELNMITGEMYQIWDDVLNKMWKLLLETVSDEGKRDTLVESQREWIEKKEHIIKEEGDEFEGGSMQPMIKNQNGFVLTRARVYELASYFGPEFTYALIEEYGFVNGESHLGYVIEENSIEDDGDCYIVDVTMSRPISVPADLKKGEGYSITTNLLDICNTWVEYQGNGILISEDGEEFYYRPDPDEEEIILFEGSDDRVDAIFYKGKMKVSKNCEYRIQVLNETKQLEQGELEQGLWFNGAIFDQHHSLVKCVFYGD